jgi:hypothetical protein
MLRLLSGAAFVLCLALPVQAATITLGGQVWTLGGTDLQLNATPAPTDNQPRNTPCIICGANQPQQNPNTAAGFGYNDFGNTGNQTDLAFFSSGIVRDHLAGDTIGTPYSAGFLQAFDPALTFSIGIDMNDTNTAQVLESFFFLNLTTHTVLASYSPGPGGTLLPSLHNGTGFPDYTLTGLSLAGINPGDDLLFYARISGANDGPDSFFFQSAAAVPGPIAGAGIPGLIVACLGLIGLARRRRKS